MEREGKYGLEGWWGEWMTFWCFDKLSMSGSKLSMSGCKISMSGCKVSMSGCKVSMCGCKVSMSGCALGDRCTGECPSI